MTNTYYLQVLDGGLEKEANWLTNTFENPDFQRAAKNFAVSAVPGMAYGYMKGKSLGDTFKYGLGTGAAGAAMGYAMGPETDYWEGIKGIFTPSKKAKDPSGREDGLPSNAPKKFDKDYGENQGQRFSAEKMRTGKMPGSQKYREHFPEAKSIKHFASDKVIPTEDAPLPGEGDWHTALKSKIDDMYRQQGIIYNRYSADPLKRWVILDQENMSPEQIAAKKDVIRSLINLEGDAQSMRYASGYSQNVDNLLRQAAKEGDYANKWNPFAKYGPLKSIQTQRSKGND